MVSIITPAYNHVKYISGCIESVLTQTCHDWEQIIVDDASTDGTSEIIEEYAKTDKRIKHIRHEENYGTYRLADSYNEALNISQGEFVAILDGDDLWPPDKLEKQLKLFANEKVVLTWGAGRIIDEDGNLLGMMPKAWKRWHSSVICNRPVGAALKILLMHSYLMPASTLVFRSKALQETGGFWQPQGFYAVDYPTCLRIALKGEFLYSEGCLGYWRNHSEQVSSIVSYASDMLVGEIFWNRLSEEKKKMFGIEKLEMPLSAWSWWIKGRRLMALGQRRSARQFFLKALFAKQGGISLRAGITLLVSFFAPVLLQSKFRSSLGVSVWWKKIIKRRLNI